MRKVDIIVPVYKGLDETRECILSVMASVDTLVGRLIVINDASPEPELTAWLIAAEQVHGFTLLHNPENLGFVATVNRGMEFHSDCDVLLLNSDVEVSGDWLTRMRDGAYQYERVGSLTPFSNNATICSFPNFCQDNELLFDLSVKQLDNHFSDNFSSSDLIRIPTAVGFCMYIRRDCLDDVGYFDVETFGKGYGEENDWCQRAEKLGWPNYQQANVFVYHKGGVSFDLEQEPRKAKAMELLTLKHPDYDAKIQTFIAEDPVRKFRIKALWTLFARSSLPKALMLTHRLGGGVQQHVNELSHFYEGEALFLQLMPLEDGVSVSLSICSSEGSLLDCVSYQVDSEYGQLVELLSGLGVGRVHFHHTMGLHPKLWGLHRDLDCQYDLTIHDYYFINGNPTLTDGKARFVGDDDGEAFDSACAEAYPIPVSGRQWRKNIEALIANADRVIFPSFDSCERFNRFFTIRAPIIAWHPDHILAQPYPELDFKSQLGRPLSVLVLGALSREKGADLLENVAKKMVHGVVEFNLLGYAYRPLNSRVSTSGPYENKDVHQLIEAIAPDVIWFPAQLAETYSYTLSLALETGLPVVVPAIGAFAERVRGRSNSVIVDWDQSLQQWCDFWEVLSQEGRLPEGIEREYEGADQTAGFYPNTYLTKIDKHTTQLNSVLVDSLMQNDPVAVDVGRMPERALRNMWYLSRRPVVRQILKWVPFNMKQSIKRRLSPRSMQDILKG